MGGAIGGVPLPYGSCAEGAARFLQRSRKLATLKRFTMSTGVVCTERFIDFTGRFAVTSQGTAVYCQGQVTAWP